VVSIFFLLLQIFILIDLAYDIHQYLLESKIEKEDGAPNTIWQIIYLLLSFCLVSSGIVGIGLLYHFYGKCPLHQFFITFTLLLGIIVFLISITEKAGVGILVPSVVFTYNVYLTWKAVFSNPDQECNPRSTSYDNTGMVAVGLIITALSLTYTTWSAGVSAPKLCQSNKSDAMEDDDPNAVDMGEPRKAKSSVDVPSDGAATGTGTPAPAASASVSTSTEAETGQKFRNNWFFHLIMALGAIFMSMLLTNWGQAEGGDKETNSQVSTESMWIKIISVWITYLLFLWTILAPCIFPDRDFSDNNNSFRKEQSV